MQTGGLGNIHTPILLAEPAHFETRMLSSRMHTTHFSGQLGEGGAGLQSGVSTRGVSRGIQPPNPEADTGTSCPKCTLDPEADTPPNLERHTPRPKGRHLPDPETDTPLPHCMLGYTPCEQNDRQM